MLMKQVESIFSATHYLTDKGVRLSMTGAGNEAVKAIRRDYPAHKIVLEGFKIDGKFHALDIRNNFNRI